MSLDDEIIDDISKLAREFPYGDELPERFLPCEDDPPMSAGLCATHGYYNVRFTRCPVCAKTKEKI